MNRDRFFERLNEVLDNRAAPEQDAELESLARDDVECRELLSAYGALREGLRQQEAPAPADDLAARVLAELEKPQPAGGSPVSSPNGYRMIGWLSAAAAVLVAASLGWVWFSGSSDPGPGPEAPLVEADEKEDGKTPDENVSPEPPIFAHQDPDRRPQSVESLLKEAGSKYLSLADETRSSFSELAMLLPDMQASPQTAPEQTTSPERAWIEQVGSGFEPVTDRVNSTLDMLLKSIPLDEQKRS